MNNYLLVGISALARTKNQFDYPWFFGHSGASVLAGGFLLAQNAVSSEVREAIEARLDEVIAGDEQLFEPVDFEAPEADRQEFLDILTQCVNAHSTTGHGVIFGTLALKACTIEPGLFTQEVSNGLVALLSDCLEDVPNRHYGIADYHSSDVDYTGIRYFASAREAADFSLRIHGTVYADQVIGDTYYFLAGDLLHAVTYAHALLELEELGYGELVSEGLVHLSRHIFLSSRSHPALEPITVKTVYDPTTIEFWRRTLNEPHQIKLAYSGMALTASLSPDDRVAIFSDLSKYW